MNSSESSPATTPGEREESPLLSFIVLTSVIVGVFVVARKLFRSTLLALILAFLAYVFRDDLKKEIGKVLPHDRD